MSKIDELIQELCPDGVEVRELGDVVTFYRGKALSKSDKGTGDTPIILYGELYTTYGDYITEVVSLCANEKAKKGTEIKYGDIIMPITSTTKEAQIGKASALKVHGSVYLGGDAIALRHEQEPGYLVHLLNSAWFEYLKMQHRTGTTVSHLSPKGIAKIKIPIPPLEVQKEIVSILDKFTQLEAELSAELDARRKQYEYYRNQLLTFDETAPVRSLSLGDLGKIVTGRTPKSSESNYWGNAMQFVTPSDIKTGSKYISAATRQLSDKGASAMKANVIPANSILVTCIGSDMGKTVVNVSECVTNQQINSIILDDGVSADYVYHLLASKVNYLKALGAANGSTMPIINKSSFSKIEIELPPLETQIEIAKLLDKFDLLVNDIQEGLPAEITARRQQYEYYRTKLLTFQELSA